jgi:peptidyl-prolyl cis-trans isomerase C
MNAITLEPAAPIARINGVALHEPGEQLPAEELRQRGCTELLRQKAVALGIGGDTTTQAIDTLLEREISVPEPTEDACRRYFDASPARFAHGERLSLRHILFAVTPGVDVKALRMKAEALLLDLRCADDAAGEAAGDAFASAAARWSNCPTGASGGDLGWVTQAECAPEFARQVFAQQTIGILPRLVHSRFGFHVIDVRAREPGVEPAFEDVRAAIALRLRHQTWANALRQYLQVLAGSATLENIELNASDSPLVQ